MKMDREWSQRRIPSWNTDIGMVNYMETRNGVLPTQDTYTPYGRPWHQVTRRFLQFYHATNSKVEPDKPDTIQKDMVLFVGHMKY